MKCKPLPIFKRRPFFWVFFFSFKMTLFHRDVAFMLMGSKRPMRSGEPPWLSVNVLPLDVEKKKAYFAATTIRVCL